MARGAFLLTAEAGRLAPKTLLYYQQQPFLAYLQESGVTTPGAITANHIRAYLLSLRRRGFKDNSQHAAARFIRAFCSFMVNKDYLAESPMRKVHMPTLDKRILPAFTAEDVHKLLDACLTLRDTAMVLCLLDSACRASEFVALNIGDIDLDRRRDGAPGQAPQGPSSVLRREGVDCPTEVPHHGVDSRPSEPLWPSANTGERWRNSGLLQMLKRLGKRSGAAHCHPHTLRRTCALWSLRAGMSIHDLLQVMGHADLAMLWRYLALLEHDLEDAHRRYGALDNILQHREHCSRTSAGPVSALVRILVRRSVWPVLPAAYCASPSTPNRSRCTARAFSTRARTAAGGSPSRSSVSLSYSTRGTSRWMSIRSNSGPEMRRWYRLTVDSEQVHSCAVSP